jgi:hypothetical protein
MVDRGWGRIINVSSVNGSKGAFGQTNYSAAKAVMHGFSKALALEVARKRVTINTISPGYIGTKMVTAILRMCSIKNSAANPYWASGEARGNRKPHYLPVLRRSRLCDGSEYRNKWWPAHAIKHSCKRKVNAALVKGQALDAQTAARSTREAGLKMVHTLSQNYATLVSGVLIGLSEALQHYRSEYPAACILVLIDSPKPPVPPVMTVTCMTFLPLNALKPRGYLR